MLLDNKNLNSNVPLGMVQVDDFRYIEANDISSATLTHEARCTVVRICTRPYGATNGVAEELSFTLTNISRSAAEDLYRAFMDRLSTARRELAMQNYTGPRDC